MNGPTEAVATAVAALAATTTFGTYLARRSPGPLAGRPRAARTERNRAQDERDLARRKDPAPMDPSTLANDERSPDWCHRHNCHRSACPGPN